MVTNSPSIGTLDTRIYIWEMTSRIPIRCGPFHNRLSHSARWSLLLTRPKFNPSNPHSRLLRCFQGSSYARYKSTDSTNPNAQSQSSHNSGSKQQNANESDSSGTKWYIPTIPISVGIATIAILHYRKVYKREQQRVEDELEKGKQGAIVMEGPWQLHLLLSLPLRSLSRLWGHVNNTYTIPTPLRTPLYSLYAWLFDCNLDEMKEKDLKTYKNLGEFFFREIDVQRFRKVDWDVDLISPADGDLIHFGMITPCRHISHIKDHKYSVDILLGHHHPDSSSPAKQATQPRNGSMAKTEQEEQKELLSLASTTHSPEIITHPEKFAEVNTIQYGVSELIGGAVDESDLPSSDSTSATSVKMGGNGKGDVAKTEKTAEKTGLFFAVIYLAPGDYHRFHSPTEWIVKERRHIHGELLSVSPRLLNMVPTLFTLNERVALLGEWKHGFFGMVPVGATNVGSVVVGFDEV
ncbi:phosphatidylserine decarboxylase-domain-containing protein [Paraphysoderma sedebokerense]|nr:phosphatidylserine decarboxylase-domain-containing protein [Paraphysoderma sedebokerense]KAI9139693.1 phosphatidylserine decarboxylase-domain-containing protein [Paraphysoderma sedebokerense]KAI9139699.1 phosphatidylserine decarboxylase-domain-containing protein [Paraphysoderma sedebokerense]